MRKMLKQTELHLLEEMVYRLLARVGMKVETNELTSALAKKGCREGPDGRVRFPREALSELIAIQKARSTRVRQARTPAERPSRPRASRSGVMPCAFGPGVTRYYDFDQKEHLPVNTALFSRMIKFADATPEIARVRVAFRQDSPPAIEGIESLVLGLKLSKKVTGIDAIWPGYVRYLVEISEIVTGEAGDTTYLGGSQCMTPPLCLGHRAAGEILERAQCGVHSYYVATMPMIGVSTPVTLAGAIAIAAAEVLGGMMAVLAVNPEAECNGTSAATVLDMATGNAAMNAPETALVDVGVKELFDACFGGHVTAHIRYAPTAKVPGLHAVYENFYATIGSARFLNPNATYTGTGTLDMARVGSPEQAILDIEVRNALAHLDQEVPVNEETAPLELMCEQVLTGSSFLESEHAVRHCREMWNPQLFLRRVTGPDWDGSERAILTRCNEIATQNLSEYEPPEWPSKTLRALDDLVARARRELA